MELRITEFFKNAAPRDYSASIAEMGENAGAITWGHAVEDSPEYLILDNEEKLEAFREFVRGSGGWNDEEIKAWSDTELNALLLQWIAGDIRESFLDTSSPDWEEHQKLSEAGTVAGRLFEGTDGEIYFYIGS